MEVQVLVHATLTCTLPCKVCMMHGNGFTMKLELKINKVAHDEVFVFC